MNEIVYKLLLAGDKFMMDIKEVLLQLFITFLRKTLLAAVLKIRIYQTKS